MQFRNSLIPELHIFTVFGWGYATDALKGLHKMLFIVVSDPLADLIHTKIGLLQQSFSLLHTKAF